MAFDDLITLFFLIIFFVVPSLFKQIKARAGKKDKQRRKTSIFGNIGEQITAFLREVERQGKERQKKAKQGESSDKPLDIWQILAGEKVAPEPETNWEAVAVQEETVSTMGTEEPPEAAAEEPAETTKREKAARPVVKSAPVKTVPGFGWQRSNPLQNAVVWSEILGKPVGLKEE